MNVRVAIGAFVADVREHHFDVAGRAGHTHVHAAQRIFCLIVIEFRNSANRLPALGGVAVGARDIETAVRTLGRGDSLTLPARMQRGEQDHHPTDRGKSLHCHHSQFSWIRLSNATRPEQSSELYTCNSLSS